MEKLDLLIRATREDRRWFHDKSRTNRGYKVDALACAIRERALLDAREAIVGKVEVGYDFRNCLKDI